MRPNWLVCAAVTACAALPAAAQTDATVVVTAPGMGTMGATTEYTNVDLSKVRSNMDELRGFLTRMQENSRLAWSTSDFVHMDAYRRTNAVLLDNASGVAMGLREDMGPATRIPPGLGATRNYIEMVVNHLAHARMMHDFTTPVDQAKGALDNAYESLDRANTAMAGYNMSGMGTRGSLSTGTMDMGTNMNNSGASEPGMNQSNPGLSNYNQQNDAATGVGATTSVPNTTPGQPGTGDTNASE